MMLAGWPQGLLLVLLGVVAVVAVSAMAYTALIYTAYLTVRARTPGGLPAARVLRALLVEACSSAVIIALGLVASLRTRVQLRRGTAGGVPVLCVHGYTQNWGNFVAMAPALSAAGCGPVVAVNIRGMFASLHHGAQQVAQHVLWLCQKTGASQVDVVCHSMGGLLLRLALRDHGVEGKVRRTVTLGTPHHGTLLANVGLGTNARQMRRDSPVIAGLPPPPPALTSVWSTADGIVLPPQSASVAGQEVVFDDLGHLSLLLSPRVRRAVVQALTSDLTAPQWTHPAPAATGAGV